MRFRFPLERLQRVRAIEEQVARAAWSAAERAAREAEEATLAARTTVEEARQAALPKPGDPLDPDRAELDRRAIDRLLTSLRARKERALTARGQAARLADAWRARERDRRALAELEDRRRAQHRRETESAEARALDQVALERLQRRSGTR